MGDRFERAYNAVEFVPEKGRRRTAKRDYVVVDGKQQEFQKELDRLGLSRVKEQFHIKDHRTDCFLRFYTVRAAEVGSFQQAALDLADHMPQLGYPDYEKYALQALVEFDCISADLAREQTGRDIDEHLSGEAFPDALFNVCGLRTDLPRSLFWRDVMVVEGKEQEGRRLLSKYGFAGMKVYNAVSHREWPQYVLFTCRVPKKQWEEFVEVMHVLEKNMLIFGYRDYEEACAAMFHSLKEKTNQVIPN